MHTLISSAQQGRSLRERGSATMHWANVCASGPEATRPSQQQCGGGGGADSPRHTNPLLVTLWAAYAKLAPPERPHRWPLAGRGREWPTFLLLVVVSIAPGPAPAKCEPARTGRHGKVLSGSLSQKLGRRAPKRARLSHGSMSSLFYYVYSIKRAAGHSQQVVAPLPAPAANHIRVCLSGQHRRAA